MDLEVIRVVEQGDAKNEYVVIRAQKACDLKGYMILDETYKDDGSTSNKHRHVFTFPSWEVEEDEYIFISTRSGTNRKGKTTEGTPASYFYWGLNSSVWNEEGDKVHLVKIESAVTFKVPSAV
ncbi:hypothetical protein CD58_18305 [Pseudomonas brassicacearum]|uniref:hypothetical protein n=1 Tax=Pseudomonas brassicacearum TaxID=930166 RepID=UPI00042EDB3C|nr:hypothetical protein [Pseudomonas brassicacearum]AHL34729.1 hypothetical protein CD58_18305 [Pseudomonas brassicacearum]